MVVFYPGVFNRWRFHMTLTRRLTPTEHALYRPTSERGRIWVN